MQRDLKNRKMEAALWGMSIAWMTMIFIMSSMPGDASGEQSSSIVQLIVWFFPGIDEKYPMLEIFVRKAAHMTEYGVLFLLYRGALLLGGKKHAGAKALALAVLYASTDEFHQMFVPDRGPSPMDVAIDGCGAMIAWALALGINKIKGRFKR